MDGKEINISDRVVAFVCFVAGTWLYLADMPYLARLFFAFVVGWFFGKCVLGWLLIKALDRWLT